MEPVWVNPEHLSNRIRVLMHRLVARQIARDPQLVLQAREVLENEAETHGPGAWTDPWRLLLALPIDALRRVITRRDEYMTWLRQSSPFPRVEGFGFAEFERRRRIWRLAKRGLVLRLKRHRAAAPAEVRPEFRDFVDRVTRHMERNAKQAVADLRARGIKPAGIPGGKIGEPEA